MSPILSCHPPAEARQRFEASAIAARLATEAPNNLATLRGFFNPEPAPTIAALLRAIAADGPSVTETQIAAVSVPTLVIGHGADIAHPINVAVRLAELIKTATFVEMTPKAVDRGRYVADFRSALARFIGDF